MPTNAIKLPAALEKFVASQVREGTYRSRETAIVAAVSHQKRRSEQLAWLQSEVQKGLDSGPAVEFSVEKIIRRGRRRLAARAVGSELMPRRIEQCQPLKAFGLQHGSPSLETQSVLCMGGPLC